MSTLDWNAAAVVDLAFPDGQRGVALDDACADAAHGLNAERQGSDVQQKKPADFPGQHAALQTRAHRHALVRIDALERLPAGEAGNRLLHRRNAGEPPTSRTLLKWEALMPESCIACRTGPMVASTRDEVSSLNFVRESVYSI